MADLDLNWIAERAKDLGYAPVYVALIRNLRVVQRSPLVLDGPPHALAMSEPRENTEASGRHGWWLAHELPFLIGEPCGFVTAAVGPDLRKQPGGVAA